MRLAFAAFRRTSILACLAGWLTLGWSAAPAADPTIRNFGRAEQFFFDTYGVESGLPGVVVNSVCQTRDGYLWVATGGGISRFDGVRFTSFRPSDTPALQTPLIYRFLEGRDGTLWIGTARGLVRYRDHTFERVGLEECEIHALAEDREGRLWIGTFGRGLFVREGDRIRHVDDPSLAGPCYVFRLFFASDGRLWIGTDPGGLVCYADGVFQHSNLAAQLPSPVEAIAEQPAGTLWFGTRSDGLWRVQGDTVQKIGRTEGLIGPGVADLANAAGGGLWVVSGKLQRIMDPAAPVVTTLPEVPRDRVFGVYEDREGSIWLSAKERGLVRGGSMPYRLMSRHDGLPNDAVRSIVQDRSGNLLLAVQGRGVMQLAPDGTLSMTRWNQDDIPGLSPTVVLVARDGALWIGTAAALYVVRGEQAEVFTQIRSVYGLFEDSRGAIWVGTVQQGLFRHENGQFNPVMLANNEPILHAASFCEGPDGSVYATTWSSGFVQVRGGRAIRYGRADGLPTDEVRAVYADADNRIWLGFRGHGLGLWQDGRCWSSDALAQAVFDHVSAIVEDVRGQLWLGTPAGVMWVAKADLLAAARGQKDAAELHVAQVNRSLRAASVWSGSQSVVCAARDGTFLFATREGILAIDPQRVSGSGLPPPVYVERVAIDGRRVDPGADLTLAAGARNLVIDYTAPSFVEASQVLFKYRLEGYDADWVDAKTRRVAAYGSLAPGRYTFHVIACNADGVWNNEGATLTITQRPRFYQTPWFFGLICLGVVGIGVGLHRWSSYRLTLRLERLEAKQATERERRRIAKNLHDDLGANLTEIGLFAESIQQKLTMPDASADIAALSERVRNLAGTLDAIVWSANPENDSLDRLATFVCGLFQDLCRMAGVRCRIDQPDALPACALTPDERSNLFLAAREAMTNLAKHAGASEAWLRMRMEGSHFIFTLEDNGRGFDLAVAQAGNRNGLANIRSRVAELKGTVVFESAPGRGTVITIRVPLKL